VSRVEFKDIEAISRGGRVKVLASFVNREAISRRPKPESILDNSMQKGSWLYQMMGMLSIRKSVAQNSRSEAWR
jgi:hypothetical protein